MADHLGRDRCLVDEHKARRIKLGLLGLQLGASGSDIGAILFSGVQSFSFASNPSHTASERVSLNPFVAPWAMVPYKVVL